jgi:tubulin--tyrosine ligase-like protein 12
MPGHLFQQSSLVLVPIMTDLAVIQMLLHMLALQAPEGGGSGYGSLSGYESYGEAGIEVWSQPTNRIVVQETPPTEELVSRIQDALWRFCNPYTINNSPVPIWYVMDEFGSRIPHSDKPTVAMTSFFYVPRQLAYCLLWPLKDLSFGDTVTRDYLEGMGPVIRDSPLQKACHLLPWSCDSHLTPDDPRWEELPRCVVPPLKERCSESLPDPSVTQSTLSGPPFSVFTDMDLVRSFLTHPSFKFTEEKGEADIIWCHDHFKEFSTLRPGCFVNQFACENVLTCKDLLVQTAKRAAASSSSSGARRVGVVHGWEGPEWLPVTYNLMYELPHLVWHHRLQESNGKSNFWIVKPWNLGRGMDIHITSSLHHIIRLAQSGPKVSLH